MQRLGIRRDQVALRAEEVPIPDADHAEQHRQVLVERRIAEMLVHLVSAFEQALEVLRTDRNHDRQAHRRPQRIAAADPVPHLEHVLFRDAELDDFLRIRRHADKVLRQRVFRAALFGEPVAHRARVGHRLERRERLRHDDRERLFRVDGLQHVVQVGAIDVGDEVRIEFRRREMMQRVHDHLRTQVRAADADVHHMADALARIAGPRAVADLVGERGHLGFLGADLLLERRVVGGRAQRRVQRRAMLGHVDDVACEHRVAALRDLRLRGEFDEQLERGVGDAVLREVDRDAAAAVGEALGARRRGVVLRREPVAQALAGDFIVMRLKRRPGGKRNVRHGGPIGFEWLKGTFRANARVNAKQRRESTRSIATMHERMLANVAHWKLNWNRSGG